MKKKNVFIDENAIIGKNVKIDDNVSIVGDCFIGDGCQICSGSVLCDVVLGDGCEVKSSHIEKSNFGKNCLIGPFANVRPNCIVADNVKIGAFVETKNVYIGKGCKMAHLSYVGDAELGENVNVGCGVVFANYDGVKKQKSYIGNNVFIGCNVNVIAPVKIADDTYICAGTTVTKDTEAGDFVIGRVRQENKKRR